MTGVQTCALPICFPVTIGGERRISELEDELVEFIKQHSLEQRLNELKWAKTMPTVKVKISCEYTDYLNIDIRADESVAEALLEAVTELLAKASSKQLTPPKDNRKDREDDIATEHHLQRRLFRNHEAHA